MGVASLVLGIISLVFVILPFLWPLAWIGGVTGIVGLVLGILARKKLKAAGQPTGSATAGFVMSIIGTVLSAIIYIACVAMVASAAKTLNDPAFQEKFKQEMEKSMKEAEKEANK